MSAAQMFYSSLVVLLMTGLPVLAVDRELGIWWCTKFVFICVFVVSELFFVFFAIDMSFLKIVFAGLGVSLISIFGSWVMYFWRDTFRGGV